MLLPSGTCAQAEDNTHANVLIIPNQELWALPLIRDGNVIMSKRQSKQHEDIKGNFSTFSLSLPEAKE